MKKLVGQRTNPRPELREALLLVDAFLPGAQRPTKVKIDGTICKACRAPVEIFMSETINTGEIWLEGPDACPGCGAKLSDENGKFQPLSQVQIQVIFGNI